MNEHRTCTCPASKSESFQIATDHYGRNFIPTGWKLEYTSLEQHEPQRFLYMTGCAVVGRTCNAAYLSRMSFPVTLSWSVSIGRWNATAPLNTGAVTAHTIAAC